MDIDDALTMAIEIYEVKKYLPSKDYDWRSDVITLVEANVFTTRQAAAITGRNPQYVQKEVRGHFLENVPEGFKPRAFGGVSGNFNPESLQKIQYVRNRYKQMHTPGRSLDEMTRKYVADLLREGNGVSLIAHLTGISRNVVEALRKAEVRRGEA